MAFMNSGGMIFQVNPIFNGISPGYVNECVPDTVGVGDSVPVRVRVRVTQSVQIADQTVTQGNSLQVTVQQNLSLLVPVQQGITNPVRQRQTINQQEEIPVASVQPVNQALQDFANNSQNDAAVNIANPMIDTAKDLAKIAKVADNVIDTLSQEVGVANATAVDLAEEAAKRAGGGIDEALQLAQKVKLGQVPVSTLQQALSKSGVLGEAAKEIMNVATNVGKSAEDLAATLSKNIGNQTINAVNNIVQSARNSRIAQTCSLG